MFGNRTAIFTSIISLILIPGLVMSQNKDGFYDEYDRNLRNLPGSDGSGEEEIYRNYRLPLKKKNNFAVTPKKVGKFYDPLAGIPGAGAGSIEDLANQGAGKQQQLGQSDSFINPITGEINYEAAQNSLNRQDSERDRKEKDKKRFIQEKTYEESKLRRFQIIFFLTLPVALGVSVGVAAAADVSAKIAGSVIMIVGTLGLSSANAYQDLQKMDEHKKEHGTEWKDEDYDFYNLEIID